MDTAPLVAIIVLNYNGKACLSRALESLHALDYEAKRIIVVDNHSQDGSFEIAKKSFPACIFLHNAMNIGFAAGMNVGIREAFRLNAKYIWLFNNDASADVSTLAELVRFCESKESVGAVSPIVVHSQGKIWFSGGKISYLRMRASHDAGVKDALPYQSEYLSGCALFAPSTTLKSVGLLDERYFLYYEDADLSVRIRKTGRELFVIPSARVSHSEQSEGNNPEKVYHLVLSGLHFFNNHTPILLRPWVWGYEQLRRFKNQIDLLLRRENAPAVRRAYREYDTKKHSS